MTAALLLLLMLPLCVALESLELFQLIKCTSSVITFPGIGALHRVLIAGSIYVSRSAVVGQIYLN